MNESAAVAPAAFRRALGRWFRRHGRDLPWRGIDDPYAILVSEIMLQQTQVATVVDYFHRWMRRFPDFAALAAAAESEVLHAWQGLGYYSRARNLHKAAGMVVESHAGRLPRDIAAIRALPGIGAYTAGALATFAFDQPEPAIDGNVARVLARLFNFQKPIDTSDGAAQLRKLALQLQPNRNAGAFNAALMELGALVCGAGKPRCGICPVRQFCAATTPAALPKKRPRRQTIHVEERRAFIRSRRGVLLQEETGRRWRGLWTLPVANGAGEELLAVRYPITHHQVTMHIVREPVPRRPQPAQRWVTGVEIEALPMPSPHRKALRQLLATA